MDWNDWPEEDLLFFSMHFSIVLYTMRSKNSNRVKALAPIRSPMYPPTSPEQSNLTCSLIQCCSSILFRQSANIICFNVTLCLHIWKVNLPDRNTLGHTKKAYRRKLIGLLQVGISCNQTYWHCYQLSWCKEIYLVVNCVTFWLAQYSTTPSHANINTWAILVCPMGCAVHDKWCTAPSQGNTQMGIRLCASCVYWKMGRIRILHRYSFKPNWDPFPFL